ncbi:hypothetical protein RRG08_021205 [Elysia crispata]|uniref:Uncharacterized protein n=1 Tax=Elysia crispata TaxID=231223 RepID=A0AAE0YQN7_9GAST|nr:hypothetical protein RRG08_021205 [Elysia crispata]
MSPDKLNNGALSDSVVRDFSHGDEGNVWQIELDESMSQAEVTSEQSGDRGPYNDGRRVSPRAEDDALRNTHAARRLWTRPQV